MSFATKSLSPNRAGENSFAGTETICIEGKVKRIAIITFQLAPCACYLARRLHQTGVEIFLFDQQSTACPYNSWKFFYRLLRKRGLYCCIDNLLLFFADIQTRCVRRASRYVRLGLARIWAPRNEAIDSQSAGSIVHPPVLRTDPGIILETWLNYIPVNNINSGSDQKSLMAVSPDLILLAGAPYISLKTAKIASVSTMNPHCGLSPRYAGNSPAVWANFDCRFDDIGYTVHVVNATLDGGPIVHQERVKWDKTDRIAKLWPILAQRMYDCLIDITNGLITGKKYTAYVQSGTTVRPPAGLITKAIAEYRRQKHAAACYDVT